MAQMCEECKLGIKMRYILPPRAYESARAHKRVAFPSKAHAKPPKPYDIFEPIKGEECIKEEICIKEGSLRAFKRIVEIERKVLDKSLEEASLKLCSRLRVAIGLSDEFEADETALANLDGFLADLADEEVDVSELVRAARRRL